MRRFGPIVVATAAGAIALAGCSGDGDDGGADATDAGGSGAAVTIVDFAFDPGTVEVDAGGTVAWTNEDGVGHTVTAGTPGEPAGTFDLTVAAGSSIEISLDDVGSTPYFCSIHPAMTGTIEVS